MWKHGRHPHIVPFLGATIAPLQLISDSMPNGNIMEYLEKHPDADRLGLVRPPRPPRVKVLIPPISYLMSPRH